MSDQITALADLWRWYADSFRPDSPTYARISEAVADDREVLAILRQAPPAAHLPPAPLAAAHHLVLGGLAHPLADVYAGRSDADPGPLFLDLCRTERSQLLAVLESRRVQTNDCGRSALIGPALTWAAARAPGPYCLVDVGTSAGINLRCDRYRLDYGRHGGTGPVDSPVQVSCEVRGGVPPIADRLPELVRRVGIDLSPIDVSDPDDARWLMACVWPGSPRADRVAASIRLAQQHPVELVTGRADEVLPGVLAGLPTGATALVVTTWAFSYFSIEERARFRALLGDESSRRPVVWIVGDNSSAVEFLAEAPVGGATGSEVLGAIRYEAGVEAVHLLAEVHPHGNHIDWRAGT